MPFNIGPGELIIVLIIALIVVGPGKLPDVGSALGKSIREFRKAASDVKETTSLEASKPAPAPAPAPAAPAAAPVPPAGPSVDAAPATVPAPGEPVAATVGADTDEQVTI
jgi:sec-independent protein translocase protein TatA